MVQVRQSTIIDAPIEEVWAILRDFNGHDRWHPAIAFSEIEGGEPVDAVGAVRHFRLADGSELREQLLSLSDKDRRLTYCLLEAPLPLMGYVATIRLKPVTDGDATFWEWRSEFHPPAHRRDELVSWSPKASIRPASRPCAIFCDAEAWARRSTRDSLGRLPPRRQPQACRVSRQRLLQARPPQPGRSSSSAMAGRRCCSSGKSGCRHRGRARCGSVIR